MKLFAFTFVLTAAIIVLISAQDQNGDENEEGNDAAPEGLTPAACFEFCHNTCNESLTSCVDSLEGTEFDTDSYRSQCNGNFEMCSYMCDNMCACFGACNPVCAERHPECDFIPEDPPKDASCELEFGSCRGYCMGQCAVSVARGNPNPVIFGVRLNIEYV